MLFARLSLASLLAFVLAGCGPSPFVRDSELASGGRWYLLYQHGGATSILDGLDAIRAARDQIAVVPDVRTFEFWKFDRLDTLELVHDGRTVDKASVARADEISLGNASDRFVAVTACSIDLRRRDVARYMARYRAGEIIIDAVPLLPYDDTFDVSLPTFAGKAANGPAVEAAVERRIRAGLHRMFPTDSFDARVSEGSTFPIGYVDRSGGELRANDATGTLEDDRTWKIFDPEIEIDASSAAFYRRVLARKSDLDDLSGEPALATTLAPTIARLEREYSHDPRPFGIDARVPRTAHTEIGAWSPIVASETYWVRKPPC